MLRDPGFFFAFPSSPPYELHHPGYARMKMYSCRGIAKQLPLPLTPPTFHPPRPERGGQGWYAGEKG